MRPVKRRGQEGRASSMWLTMFDWLSVLVDKNEFLGCPVLAPVWMPEEVRVSLFDHPPLGTSAVT